MPDENSSLLGAVFGTCSCKGFLDCTLPVDRTGGILLFVGLAFYMFKAVGVVYDEYLQRSAQVLAARFREKHKLSEDVEGATIMAIASSVPELIITVTATFVIVNAGGLGTVIGSAIFNILVIVGVVARTACKDDDMEISLDPLLRNALFSSLAVLELLLILMDEEVRWYEPIFLLLTYCGYIYYLYRKPDVRGFFLRNCPCFRKTKVVEVQVDPDQDLNFDDEDDEEAPRIFEQPETKTDGTKEEGEPKEHIDPPPGDPDTTHLPGEPNPAPERPEDGALPSGGEAPSSTVAPSAAEALADGKRAGELFQASESASLAARTDRTALPSQEPEVTQRPAGLSQDEPGSTAVGTTSEALVAMPPSDTLQEEPSMLATGAVLEQALMPAEADNRYREPPEEDEDDRLDKFLDRPLRDPLTMFWEVWIPSAQRAPWTALAISSLFAIFLSYVMFDASTRAACVSRISPMSVGLIFLAAGTSIPDLATSVAVAKQGEGDMALANAMGSNVFILLPGLGLPWMAHCIGKGTVHFAGEFGRIVPDLIILVFVQFLLVGLLAQNKRKLSRDVGTVLLVIYAIYVLVTFILAATGVKGPGP